MSKTLAIVFTALLPIAIYIAMFAAWVTHIVYCLAHGAWGFLIAGALTFPIAIVHGVGLWFGWFQ